MKRLQKLTQTAWPLAFLLFILSCSAPAGEENSEEEEKEDEPVDFAVKLPTLNLPEGFEISLYSDQLPNARSMAMSDEGTLFIGTRDAGNVYAVTDADQDMVGEKQFVLDTGLRAPNGVAVRDGDLYVAEVSKLWRYSGIEGNLDAPPAPVLIYDDYPKDYHHGWKYIAFGPDGKLYVPVGAPCNICESQNEVYASITRMDPDGSNREVYAHGVRNTVGFTWHPETGEMWFTDNGRDMLGDDIPPCELNRVAEAGTHYGYPYCHGGTIKDPEFGDKFPCSDFVPPVQQLGAHVAPLGVKFYDGDMFPETYKGVIFIAEHGSWNRSSKVGYRITMVRLEGNEAVSYEPFIDGWLDEEAQEAWGRPVDILVLEDGSMLISDDKAGAVYRLTYSG